MYRYVILCSKPRIAKSQCLTIYDLRHVNRLVKTSIIPDAMRNFNVARQEPI